MKQNSATQAVHSPSTDHDGEAELLFWPRRLHIIMR